MNVLRRFVMGVVVLTLLVGAAAARAQVLKQLPSDALVVVKLNNAEAVSQRLGALMQRLGLANFQPDLADPLTALKKQINIKEGFDAKGDIAVGVYADPAGGPEPLGVILVAVTDYKAFLGNLPAVKDEGDGISSFAPREGAETVFVTNWGNYAAASNNKGMLAKKPDGMTIASAAAQKQFDKADLVMYANTKHIAGKVLPMWKDGKPQWIAMLDQGLAGAPNMQPKYVPVLKALVVQLLNTAEQTLTDTNGATVAINITKDGVAATIVADFLPDSYIGKLMATSTNTDANLLAGLPNRKYFAVGGATMSAATSTQLINDWLGPIVTELTKVGPEAQPIIDLVDAFKKMPEAVKSTTMGYAVPTGAPGQQALFQVAGVIQGDSAKIGELQRKAQKGAMDLMKMMPNQGGLTMESKIEDGAAEVAGVKLDKVTNKFVLDPNNPQAAQIKPMIDMMYGPNGMSGVMGAVSATTYVQAIGGDDDFNSAVVAAAKSNDAALSQLAHIKAVTAQLPPNRAAVMYIHLDNIATTVLAYAAQFGFRVPLKLQPDIAPLGVSVGTEGTALRIDVVVPNEIIENAVSATMQVMMMRQGGGARPGGGL
ncbi:MAG: hypothetical protein ACHRHE_13980 [Tepidisphaerales bacterium]